MGESPASRDGLPSVGVVIPTLDEAARIADAVRRLLAPAREPEDRADEVLVGDGGSRDGTIELARRAGARVVVTEPGRGGQLRAAAHLARADVLVFLHADNALPAGALARVRAAFSVPGLGAAAFRQRIDASGWFYRWVERAADRRVLARGMVYGDSTLCVRRALYESLGGFADLPLFEDAEFSRRLRRATEVALLEGPPVSVDARRWRSEGRTAATLRNWALRMAYAVGVAPATLARWRPLHSATPSSRRPATLRPSRTTPPRPPTRPT